MKHANPQGHPEKKGGSSVSLVPFDEPKAPRQRDIIEKKKKKAFMEDDGDDASWATFESAFANPFQQEEIVQKKPARFESPRQQPDFQEPKKKHAAFQDEEEGVSYQYFHPTGEQKHMIRQASGGDSAPSTRPRAYHAPQPTHSAPDEPQDFNLQALQPPSQTKCLPSGGITPVRHPSTGITAPTTAALAGSVPGVFPGALAVHGPDWDGSGSFEDSIHAQSNKSSEHPVAEGSSSELNLIQATLVEPEEGKAPVPSGPVVTGTRLKRSIFNDRRVQAAILVIVFAAIGLIVWAVTRDPPPGPTPTMEPTNPDGVLPEGEFCGQNEFSHYGGDFCPVHLSCRGCSETERFSICLHEDISEDILESYCDQVLSTETRGCGAENPNCPLEKICIACRWYTRDESLEGSVCLSPGSTVRRLEGKEGSRYLDEEAISDGYASCLALNGLVTVPPMPPTPMPTQDRVDPTPSPTSDRAPFEGDVQELLSAVSSDGGAALSTSGTPQYEAFQDLLQEPDLLDYSEEEIIQRYAVSVFYFSTEGDQWDSAENWLIARNVCVWEFVECDSSNTVTEIAAPQNSLSGSLPAELYLLESLVFLGLYNNGVGGTIVTEIGLLSNLANLDLDSNAVTGSIPTQLGSALNVEYLYLNNNQLVGTIPSQLGNLSNLRLLLLSNNQLTGSVPSEVCRLSEANLTVLSVDVGVDCGDCAAFADTCHPSG